MSLLLFTVAAMAQPFEVCDAGDFKACDALQVDFMRRAATLARDGVDVPSLLRQPLARATLQADLVAGRAAEDDPRCAHVPAPGCATPAASTEDAYSPSKLRDITARRARPQPRRSRTWTVEGVVRGPDGSPAVDVPVALWDDVGTNGFSAGRDLGEFLSHPYPGRVARTDSSGHYLFEEVGGKMPTVLSVVGPIGIGGTRYHPDGSGPYTSGDIELVAPKRTVLATLPDGSPATDARMIGELRGRADDAGRFYLPTPTFVVKEPLVVSADGAWMGRLGDDDASVALSTPSPSCSWRYPNGEEARPEAVCGTLLVEDVDRRWRDLDWQVEDDGNLGAVVPEPAASSCKELPWEPGLRVRNWRILDAQGQHLHPNLCTKRTSVPPESPLLEAVVVAEGGTGWELWHGPLAVKGDRAVFVSGPTRQPIPTETRTYILADGTPLAGLGVRVSDDLGSDHRQVFTDARGRVEVPVDVRGRAIADLPRRDNGAVGVYPPVRRKGAHHQLNPFQHNQPINIGNTHPDVVVGPFPPIKGAPKGTDWLDPARDHLGTVGEETLLAKGVVRVVGESGTESLLAWAGPDRVLRLDVGAGSPAGAAYIVTPDGRSSPFGLKSVGEPHHGTARPWRRDPLAIVVQCNTPTSCLAAAREVESRLPSWPSGAAALVLAGQPVSDPLGFPGRVERTPGAEPAPWEVVPTREPLPKGTSSRAWVLVDGIPRWAGRPEDLTIDAVERWAE